MSTGIVDLPVAMGARMKDSKGEPFWEMAEKIHHNEADASAAYVILPPNETQAIASLLLDTQRDALAFWTNIKSLAELQISELIQQEKQRTAGWGTMR